MKDRNVKVGMSVIMKKDYSSKIKKGMVFKVLKRQCKEKKYKWWVLDHEGEKSYLAPHSSDFKPYMKTQNCYERIKRQRHNLELGWC